MKKLLLILSLALFGSSLSLGQTTIEEQYFHELKGMEDSSGVTHLFYREYKKGQYECEGDDTDKMPLVINNNVYHLNLSSQKDSVLFADYFSEWCLDGMYESKSIDEYIFYKNNPQKWLATANTYFGVYDYSGNNLDFQVPIVTKSNSRASLNEYHSSNNIHLTPNRDSLYVKVSGTVPFTGNSDSWPVFEDYEHFNHYADSLGLAWEILGIHPEIDSLFFAINSSGDLYRSEHYSSAFTFADSSTYFRNIYFDADTSHIYSMTSSGLLHSNNLGKQNTWKFSGIDFETGSSKFLAVDKYASGNLFISDSTDILFSDNYGDTFITLSSLDDEITGLYKKPNSNLLYVLTRKELLEINTETKSVTSLKQIPVSNEVNQNEIPKQVTLNQNYPNPFNPSTVISYQLTANSLVRLEVFDVTGRKVAVLVNGERKAAGSHQVTFEAGNLASGVYFYRLETAGQTLTQKMLLVK